MNPPHAHPQAGSHGKLSRFRRLPAQAQWLWINALILLPLNWAGLRVLGYPRWRAVLGASLPRDRKSRMDAGRSTLAAPRIAQIVHAASREGWCTGACLERSLALWWLLRRRHFPAELQIGARQQAGRFEAHAWVQLNGAVLNDEEALLHYVPFETPAVTAGRKS